MQVSAEDGDLSERVELTAANPISTSEAMGES